MPGEFYQEVASEQESTARDTLEQASATSRQHGVGRVDLHLERGETAPTLIEMSSRLNTQLVVMTTHGRTGISRLALGSVADRVVRGGVVPVLLIRSLMSAAPEPVSLERVLVPLDGSPLAETALHIVQELAGPVVKEITLLRVVERDDSHESDEMVQKAQLYLDSVRDRLAGPLAESGCSVSCQTEVGDTAESIARLSRSGGGVVVMATHGETGIGRWAKGSTADQVIRDSQSSLLLVHAKLETAK